MDDDIHAALRVLMVTGAYYPEISSSGLQCQAIARTLRDRAVVEVLTTATNPDLPRRELIDGVRVRRVYVDVTRTWSRLRAALLMIVRLVRSVPRVDLVHIHGVSTKNVLVTAAAKAFRRPLVLSLHTAGHDEPQTIAAQGTLAWRAYAAADLYLSVSGQLVDALVAAGFPPERIRLVANGIDVSRFSPASASERCELRRRLQLSTDGPVILFVGFFSREKQPHVLLDAWLDLQRNPALASTLVFVGATRSKYFEVDADLEERMRAAARARGLEGRLVFAGETLDVQDYYRAADVFVLPSNREGLPVAMLEAMSTGLAVVASRLPGATDTVIADGENGLLVPPGDVNALASSIASLMQDPARAERLGVQARTTIQSRYASGQVAEAWLDAYATALARTPRTL
jgi:glycosyltransferase involved in cell wall biosynthesis